MNKFTCETVGEVVEKIWEEYSLDSILSTLGQGTNHIIYFDDNEGDNGEFVIEPKDFTDIDQKRNWINEGDYFLDEIGRIQDLKINAEDAINHLEYGDCCDFFSVDDLHKAKIENNRLYIEGEIYERLIKS
jgi:hypothetical protein